MRARKSVNGVLLLRVVTCAHSSYDSRGTLGSGYGIIQSVRVAGASGALHVEKLLSVGAPVAGRLPVAGRSAGRPSVRPDKHTRTSANGRKVAQEVEKGAQITSKKHI